MSENVISGSFAEFNPETVIDRINYWLSEIESTREKEKKKWFDEKRAEGVTTGFWFFKKNKPWNEDKLLNLWNYGRGDDWYHETPKYKIWEYWNKAINKFERIKKFCELATDAGNSTVMLSKEDALWALDWQ